METEPIIWPFLLVLNFSFTIFGIISMTIFVKRVFSNGRFRLKIRLPLALLSLSIFLTLGCFICNTVTCLEIGTMFEDLTCQQLGIKRAFNFLLRYSEMLQYTSHFMIAIERLISINYPRFYKTTFFNTIYALFLLIQQILSLSYAYDTMYARGLRVSWAILSTSFLLTNLMIVYYSFHSSKRLYKQDTSEYSLERKHELYGSYELSRAFIIPTFFKILVQLFVYLLFWFQHFEYLFPPNERYKIVFVNKLIWNFSFTLFPWFVLRTHRGFRKQSCHWCKRYTATVHNDGKENMVNLEGMDISMKSNQKVYFDNLEEAWK